MPTDSPKLHAAIAEYLAALNANRATGATVAETTHYTALQNLLNAIGETLTPAVRCISGLSNQGAGMPDMGLFAASQFPKRAAIAVEPGQVPPPERGVIEAKGIAADVQKTARTKQVDKYWRAYRQVLVTSFREFLLVGDVDDRQTTIESFSFAPDEEAFWQLASQPRSLPRETADRFIEFVQRVMLSQAKIASPEQVAWFLASYAREARSRLEAAGALPALAQIRESFESGLGIAFDRDKGDRFFRSTLVQTLFYGIFSAWTLWHRERGDRPGEFVWETSWRYLRVPVLQSLFHRLGDPEMLEVLNLIELFDWTAGVLNRVNRGEFFARFEESEAVQYFYEPFLEAFDPDLRKEFGVWYTPPQVVRYMVERVDRVLREELGCADGLADPNVVLLDPCCGTGAYLVAAIEKIAETLAAKGVGALAGTAADGKSLKEVVLSRVFGFELLTAPLVIAHLQVALKLDELGDPLTMDGQSRDRAGVYLTNALTGWTASTDEEQQRLAFMNAFERERDAADKIKQQEPILVILGNPPYNAYSGVSSGEESETLDDYKSGLREKWGIEKHNLDDLYVRFFRIAEKHILEKTQKGVVCYITNHSYLEDNSYVVFRECLSRGFDKIWIDNLNGSSRATGKTTPDGEPDPSIFSSDLNPEGIKVGTAIGLFLKSESPEIETAEMKYRDFWGKQKKELLLASLEEKECEYRSFYVSSSSKYIFKPYDIPADYRSWPRISELCLEKPINGLMEKRGGDLIDLEKETLAARMRAYFDSSLAWDDFQHEGVGLTTDASGFDARKTREKVIEESEFSESNIVRYLVRPFDLRWCYYSQVHPLWNRSRPTLWNQIDFENSFLMARPKCAVRDEGIPVFWTSYLGDNDFQRGHAYYIPTTFKFEPKQGGGQQSSLSIRLDSHLNVSDGVRQYFRSVTPDIILSDADVSELWLHVLSICFSSQYLISNLAGVKQDWPRIPLPNDRALLQQSAQLGQTIAHLLDPETPVETVTTGNIDPIHHTIAIPTTTHGNTLKPDEYQLTANWGNGGNGKPVMPGRGKIVRRDYTDQERQTLGDAIALLGNKTNDIYLNDTTYWCNIPDRVWNYTIGGYQVIKKWLSYRALKVLGRPMKPDEIKHVVETARRISAIILMEPDLDKNYQAIKANTYPWPKP